MFYRRLYVKTSKIMSTVPESPRLVLVLAKGPQPLWPRFVATYNCCPLEGAIKWETEAQQNENVSFIIEQLR